MRPTFESIYMGLAVNLAKRSTCARLQVGAVITSIDFRYVYGLGYNGNAVGFKNACDSTEVGACGCLHAEDNAVINCSVSSDVKKVVFCTHLPCVMCAKRLVNLRGVMRVYYLDEYRSTAAFKVFEEARIAFAKLTI